MPVIKKTLSELFKVVPQNNPQTLDASYLCWMDHDGIEANIDSQTDLHMIVEVFSESGSTLAMAGPCELSTKNNMPILGIVSVNANSYFDLKNQSRLKLILHEVFHAMGFLDF